MHVFLTGVNGWIGLTVIRELIDTGHSVVGLVRSKEKGEALVAAGVTPLLGSLTDLDVLRQTVEHVFGTIKDWMGRSHFKMRRLRNVGTEMSLHVVAYNLKRVIALLGAPKLIAAMRG